ncbi:MAG: hypothetical protein ABJB01_00875 [Rudaea sp.]
MRFIRRSTFAALVVASLCVNAHAAGPGLAGSYHIHGTNPDGRPYEGALHIEQKGETYALTWDSGGTTHGVGVLHDGKLVVGYGDPACGVVAYKAQTSGTLDGRWAMSNSTQLGTETATPAQGTATLAGDYVVSGTNTDQTKYKGALIVSTDGADGKLSFSWRTGPDQRGFGFQAGSMVAGTFGPPSCGVVMYSVAPDGVLSGQWSMLRGGLGSEQAKKTD